MDLHPHGPFAKPGRLAKILLGGSGGRSKYTYSYKPYDTPAIPVIKLLPTVPTTLQVGNMSLGGGAAASSSQGSGFKVLG